MQLAFEFAMLTVWGLLLVRWLSMVLLGIADHVRQRRRAEAIAERRSRPRVTVLVPAYNEAAVIAGTIESLAASDYDALDIVVVDDGSADDTASIARATGIDTLTVLVQATNQGKASALNRGLEAARGELILTIDADTKVDPDCVRTLVQTLLHTRADAVASNVKVGNRSSLVGRLQSIEYVTGLNIDRRAQCMLDIITTVPGAAALWRRDVLQRYDGFSSDTLAEDTDLTLTLLRNGHKIEFADRAISRTEAPSTWGQLFRQRVRWLYGNLQCAYKHSNAWTSPAPPAVKLLALPNLWWAHLGVYVLFPVSLVWAALLRESVADAVVAWIVGSALSLDVVIALLAYQLDRDRTTEVLLAPIQRVVYPLFLFAVFVTVMVRIALRRPFGWNKLERSGALD